MRRREYSYVTFRERRYPLVPIKLYHGENSTRTYALLDSGSTLSVFRAEIAEDLGIRVEEDKEMLMQSANATLKVHVHQVRVEVNGDLFNLPIGFSHELTTSFNILGREGFFERFRVVFDEKLGTIILES